MALPAARVRFRCQAISLAGARPFIRVHLWTLYARLNIQQLAIVDLLTKVRGVRIACCMAMGLLLIVLEIVTRQRRIKTSSVLVAQIEVAGIHVLLEPVYARQRQRHEKDGEQP